MFELLDFVKIWEMGLFLVKNVNIWKSANKKPFTLSSNPWFSVSECPKILNICQITKFDMGFQKINMSSRFEKLDFFVYGIFSDSFTLNIINEIT